MRDSDEDRFADFVAARSATLFRIAYLMTGDHHHAEDLLRTTLLRVYQHWTRVEATDDPVAHARRILVNQAVSGWRRRSSRKLPLVPSDVATTRGDAEDTVEHERVWRAVLSLPPRQRAVTVLRHYEDLSEADIAHALDWAPATVRSHGRAAARRLGELLADPVRGPTARRTEATP